MKISSLISKAIMAAGLICLIIFFSSSGVNVNKTVEDINNDLSSVMSLGDMEPKGQKELKRYYGITEDEIDSYVLYGPKSNMGADELLILKAKSEDQAESLEALIENRLEEKKTAFEGYGTEQMGIINNAVIEVKGPFVFFSVADEATELESAFLKSVRK